MEPVKEPKGYVPPADKRVEDILAVEAELLRSEGVDPRWPGFDEDKPRDDGHVRKP